ncbi:neutral zinc metallopeptidase [Sporosarcina sp. ACRSM]|uniref:KPN_02809 family neutral zinc metallopeptidase n=1 Tax=Sporosarcina sp. ACRSM TaxID=2918216 RepID=UPI001EF60C52|nr:neutral zinc metallopeptidase [Sporosarcina sp. ACRSM]MCG7334739.1 neutral zinc metallopeptidase [Sporosarcina sp. ACRSM]
MEWKGRKGSANVEDRRGNRKGGVAIAGGGIGGIILILLFTFLGGDPGELLNGSQIGGNGNTVPYEETAEEKEMAEFVSVVLADTEAIWSELFQEQGMTYENPKLVLYTDIVQSACGTANSAVGPFYCPGDHKLYIDLSFFEELRDRFQAPGDFAMAYVIAHEVGHHVQTLLGTSDKVNALRSKLSEKEFNQYSVRLELQADYFAGVWAHHEKELNVLDEGDIEEAINAASAVGDDRLQRQAQGRVVPDSFTHGTSEQRKRWFSKGFEKGTINEGDTFNATNL